MTKVLFIEPTGAYSNVFDKVMTIPLLGPVYLAPIAQKSGFDVSIINENILGRKINSEELQNIDILCLSCLTATVNRGKKIARQFKSLNPNGKTILGGIHASMIPEDVKSNFDQIVLGEAENIIVDILSNKFKEKTVSGAPIQDLDSLPFPNFNLIKGWKKIKFKRWPVMTSRGCPYNCNFCSVTAMFGRKYRTRSPESVMKEISQYNEGNIFFIDDHFSVNPEETFQLLDLMLKSRFSRPWSAQIRTNVTKNSKLIAKMKEAGCFMLYFGFESPNPRTLEEIQKSQTVEDIERSIKICHENDIMILGMFMIGADSDTPDDFKLLSKFCKKQKIDFFQVAALTPLPGTPLYEKLKKEDRILHTNWDHYDGMHVVSKPLNMTPHELQKGLKYCYGRFYSYLKGIKIYLTRNKDYHYPRFPSAMRFMGKRIMKKWYKYNKSYMAYLKEVSKKPRPATSPSP